MNLTFSGCSQTGLVRPANEDAILMRVSDRGGLFLVADGVGGRAHGEIVSGMLHDAYDQWWRTQFLPAGARAAFCDAVSELKDVLLRVNRTVVERFGESAAGSTLVLLFLLGHNCLCLSAGDSRVYLARGMSFRQITSDDVCGELPGRPASTRGRLAGAVGIRAVPEFALRTDELRRGDRFFLCSDGVYRYANMRELGRRILFGRPKPEALAAGLSREIEGNGAGDNYSFVYLRVHAL